MIVSPSRWTSTHDHLPDDRSNDQHQSYHDARKVGTEDGVDDDEDVFVAKFSEAQPFLIVPIIASVSEHQPTAWPSFFFDLEMLIFLFPAGVYLCFRELRDEHVFIIIHAVG
jgi:hypothetical protein